MRGDEEDDEGVDDKDGCFFVFSMDCTEKIPDGGQLRGCMRGGKRGAGNVRRGTWMHHRVTDAADEGESALSGCF